MPPFGVRIDPFLLFLDGKLGLELEVGVWKFISVELVPVFVVNEKPPTFNIFTGREDPITRESDGLGPLAGTSIGLGFWLGKRPLEGSVLRVIFTNYAYHYKATDERGEFDDVPVVERQLFGYFGSHSTYGAFTLSGGFGLGWELNLQKRCFLNDPPEYTPVEQGCPDGELLIKTDRVVPRTPVIDLNGGLGAFRFMFRLSLGVAFN
jgi:hypothetical protein